MLAKFEEAYKATTALEIPNRADYITTFPNARMNPSFRPSTVRPYKISREAPTDNFEYEKKRRLDQMKYNRYVPDKDYERGCKSARFLLYGDMTDDPKVRTSTDENGEDFDVPVNFQAANPEEVRDLDWRPEHYDFDIFGKKYSVKPSITFIEELMRINGFQKRASLTDIENLVQIHRLVTQISALSKERPNRFGSSAIAPLRYVLFQMVHYDWEQSNVDQVWLDKLNEAWPQGHTELSSYVLGHVLMLIECLENAAELDPHQRQGGARLTRYGDADPGPVGFWPHAPVHPFPHLVRESQYTLDDIVELWSVTDEARRVLVEGVTDDSGQLLTRLRNAWTKDLSCIYRRDSWFCQQGPSKNGDDSRFQALLKKSSRLQHTCHASTLAQHHRAIRTNHRVTRVERRRRLGGSPRC